MTSPDDYTRRTDEALDREDMRRDEARYDDRLRDERPLRDDRDGLDRRSTTDSDRAGERRAPERDRASELPAEQPKTGSRTTGIWVALILGAIVLVLLLIFVVQNSGRSQFQYFGAQFQLPLGVAMLLAAVAGALVMALVGSVRIIQMSWQLRRMRKNEESLRHLVNGR